MKGDALKALWRDANALKRGLIVGLPITVIALAIAGAAFAMSGGGSSSANEVLAPTAALTDTPVPTPSLTAVPTDTPASAGLQASNAPPPSTGGGDGGGAPVRRSDPPPANLSGPGAVEGTGMSMVIPAIGVNASVYSRTIGENGQMGNPRGAYDVIWYDFSDWDGLGGAPGEPGANAVFAGHVDYIHIGPAVFWSIRDLQPGDQVIINTPGGPITYAIQWSQWAEPDTDFTSFVARTGQDSITLVTCIGGFSAGHYSNRLVVRGQRI